MYSSKADIKAMASVVALRNTWKRRINDLKLCFRVLSTNLAKWMCLDLREFVLHVVWVHRADLFTGRRPEDLDDFDQLINARLTWE